MDVRSTPVQEINGSVDEGLAPPGVTSGFEGITNRPGDLATAVQSKKNCVRQRSAGRGNARAAAGSP